MCGNTGHPIDGYVDDMWVASSMVLTVVTVIVNIRVMIFSYMYFWFSMVVLLLSILFYFLVCFMLTAWFPPSDLLDNYDSYGST